MADKHVRHGAALVCSLPGCNRKFTLRQTPPFPICPECQTVIEQQIAREKDRAKRARRAASRQAVPTLH